MAYSKIDNYVASLQRQVADIAGKVKKMQNSASFEPAEEYNYSLGVENIAYTPVKAEVFSGTLGQMDNADCGYAAESYQAVATTKEKSPIVEGLIFNNNKKFDFRV